MPRAYAYSHLVLCLHECLAYEQLFGSMYNGHAPSTICGYVDIHMFSPSKIHRVCTRARQGVLDTFQLLNANVYL